ncbi:SMI1/KNR4 family protein [Kurthia zopfii]|uniref:SMI1 / KNR4 family n=1 Tax=Kurthia zopfii TaxID=1650 RepID=A0A8B4QCX1_9BACL|nr:SMI1/KNR4 family protein [Kurthia zopfii]PWI21347.1 SMI1/KNR4 family protein [Kurthia zopfii]TDR34347.1 SUKH superfamily protein [Kurthia zopfii]GEK31853.1 SMI1/KNR4 family protein [Kurthia zopfii]STX10539.1 SMI1 / KNR4 family [Kurthia zopfii]
MNWVLVKPLKKLELINEFEQKNNITFPKSFVEVVQKYNLGRPRPNVFDTNKSKERIAKCLLSFDTENKENIWDMYSYLKKQLPEDVIPFMVDQFGNFICFYFDALTSEVSVVFWDVENQQIEKVADSFEIFISNLYEL